MAFTTFDLQVRAWHTVRAFIVMTIVQFKFYDMKKLCPLLLIVFALCGCVGTSTKVNEKFSNVQQENFDNMLARNKDKSYRLGNKILEKEFNDSVKLAMGEYMDSVKLFVNWKAQIQNINSRETGKSIALSFELEYAPEQYRKVTFDVDYILPQDSINTDKIYQTIRSLSNYSTVYFDGFIRKKANGEAHYSSYSDDLMHSYPDFKFFVVDINTTSKGDTLSNNLQNAVDLSFQAIEPLELNFKKKISKKESSKRVEKIAPRLSEIKILLIISNKDSYVKSIKVVLPQSVNNDLYSGIARSKKCLLPCG